MPKPAVTIRRVKPLVFALGLAPAGLLVWKGLHQDLGANPVEFITHATGDWTMRFLLLTLTVTPARQLAGLPDLIRFRRMLGLFAFFYGTLHMLTYLWLDQFFNVDSILKDVVKRPFITAGATAFLSMLPLALTSTTGWIRRLGGRRWQRLHRLVYLAGAAAVIHYYWLVKSDVRLPLLYAGILCVLLGWRVARAVWKRKPRPRMAASVAR